MSAAIADLFLIAMDFATAEVAINGSAALGILLAPNDADAAAVNFIVLVAGRFLTDCWCCITVIVFIVVACCADICCGSISLNGCCCRLPLRCAARRARATHGAMTAV